jgi:phytoene dehydrogenase-like protein
MSTPTAVSPDRKAIVIGGGPAGLLAAARLAAGGADTTLLEASSRLGGRAASDRRDGFDLNQGPHALYTGGAGLRELRAVGVDPDGWNPTSLSRSVLVRGGKPTRRAGGSFALTRWLLGMRRTDPAQLAGLSVSEWLRETLPERARDAGGALVRVATFVADHDSLSADVAASQIRIALLPGVRYIRGGWGTMVAALATRAEAGGAELRTRAAARAVRRAGDGWEVELDGETLRAGILLVAAGEPEDFAKLLGERAPAPPGPAAEVSSLDLGLRRLPRRGRRFALGLDRPDYLSRHSPPRHPDGTLLSLGGYARQPREQLEALADAVQPGWREQATLQRFLPRMVAVSAIATPATGGLAGRPAVDRGDGLYLAGDWLGSEGWLTDAALASGATAAEAALRSEVTTAA